MLKGLISKSQGQRVAEIVEWAEVQKGTDDGNFPRNEQQQYPIRGILLQNVYNNGSGAMQLIYRDTLRNTTKLDIVGTNYVTGSAFKLQLWGTPITKPGAPTPPTPPAAVQLAQSTAISVKSTADQLQVILTDAAQGANLPVTKSDVLVSVGNPVSDASLIILGKPTDQPEVDSSATPPLSYVGSWVITVVGALVNNYEDLHYVVFQDSTTFMKGLSTLFSQPTEDITGDSVQIVTDVFNRPQDYPWKAGSICVAIPFPGLGYGLIASDFRDQTISLPTSSS